MGRDYQGRLRAGFLWTAAPWAGYAQSWAGTVVGGDGQGRLRAESVTDGAGAGGSLGRGQQRP